MGTKEHRLHVRITEEFEDEIKTLAALRNLTVAGLTHFVFRMAIQEARKQDPAEFERVRKKIQKEHGPHSIRKVS